MKHYIVDSCCKKRTAIFVKCDGCGVNFLKIKKNISENRKNYCTHTCFAQKVFITNVTLICSWCEIKFERKSNFKRSKSGLYFCCKSCKDSAQSLNGLPETTPKHYGTTKDCHICKICGSTVYHRAYCKEHSNDKQKFKNNLVLEQWKRGEITGNNRDEETLKVIVRRYIFEKYDSKCHKCGWNQINPTTGKIPLTINHIDGDCTNSKEENLELICPNCHSLTCNYGALNKGNGRKSRRKQHVRVAQLVALSPD